MAIDPNAVYAQVNKILEDQKTALSSPTVIRLWDGNWNLLAYIQGEDDYDFKFLDLDAGDATIKLPIDHDLSTLLSDTQNWPTKSLYVTFDKSGARWSGRVQKFRTEVNYKGDRIGEVIVIHDYMKLKELLVWANPFLPAEVQFPKAWFLYGPSKWAVASTLFVNLLRKNNSLWMVPDDPMDLGQWFDLDMSNWNMAVKPVKYFEDNSLPAVVSSRFKYFHDCVEAVCSDAQLSIECRRYLEGDPQPIPGKTLRHGCLVFEVVDKSGWNKETAVGGNTLLGFKRAIARIQSDGMTEGVDYVPKITQPSEYYDSGFMGTLPQAPWVVLEHGEHTGIESTEFEYTPPGEVQFVTGGSSMPGVNEALKASMIALGGVIGSTVGQSQAGSVAEALLEPLYTDVFLAFMAHKEHSRIQEHGWDAPFEKWVDGSDKAYVLSALTSMRRAKDETRERFSCSVEMNDGAPYYVGTNGMGDFFIGDRVGVHALGMPENILMVEQVKELSYKSGEGWTIKVGKPDFSSGFEFLANRYDNVTAGLKELGVW